MFAKLRAKLGRTGMLVLAFLVAATLCAAAAWLLTKPVSTSMSIETPYTITESVDLGTFWEGEQGTQIWPMVVITPNVAHCVCVTDITFSEDAPDYVTFGGTIKYLGMDYTLPWCTDIAMQGVPHDIQPMLHIGPVTDPPGTPLTFDMLVTCEEGY